jgi:DNA-binding LacI/PurR family transcriptional regulator
MEKKAMTIRDVARMAGVSTTAVSFALNGRNGISSETKEKIMDVVNKTKFHPRITSLRLQAQKSFNIAMIYPSAASPFSDFFYSSVTQGVTEELTKNGYNVVLVPLEVEDGNHRIPTILQRQDADGVILLYTMPDSLLAEIREYKLPYVLVDWQNTDEEGITVQVDSEQSVSLAVRYLIRKGHKDIGFFGSSLYPVYYLRCLKSYQNTLAEHQLPIYPNWIQGEIHDADSAKRCLESAFLSQGKPTAVCCMSDICAIHVIHATGRMNINIPGDLSIISIDDIKMSQYTYPPLTTVSFNKNEIGRTSAKLLLKLLNGEEAESVRFPIHRIVERSSVRDLNEN